MKFSALVTLLPLLLSSSMANAAAARGVIQARQAHMKRSLVDVCTALDMDVQVAPGGNNIAAGRLNLCLCQSAVPAFLESNPVAKKVVDEVGKDGARDYFAGLIQSQKNKQECRYPAHAGPSCTIERPCDFTCGDGYAPSPATGPTECVCKPPYSECNGVCGSFPRGCSSQSPSKGKRDNPTCSAGKTVCGVPNGGNGYDCVDIKGDAESCGGCTVAPPFGGAAGGKNCKAIPNVNDVICDNGACKVLSCKDGFNVHASNDGCVKPGLRRRQPRGASVHRRNPADIDSLFNLIIAKGLFVNGFDVAAAKAKVAALGVFNLDRALGLLLSENAFFDIHDLATLKARLGLN